MMVHNTTQAWVDMRCCTSVSTLLRVLPLLSLFFSLSAGGLFRDSLSKVCLDLQSDHVPLFIPCPNQRAGVGLTLDKRLPNPSLTRSIWLSMYQFVGVLMGIAIRTNNTLELDLPSMVWKPLCGQELEVGDLTAIDQICVNAMNLILDEKALAEKGINQDNFEDGQRERMREKEHTTYGLSLYAGVVWLID